jgi:exodeoxyribonuclease V alpha subunit
MMLRGRATSRKVGNLDSAMEVLSGTLEKVVYRNDSNGFSVFILKVNKKEAITVTGCILDIQQGEYVQFKGKWGFHPKFGRQFIASSYESKLPVDVIGIQKYLSSGMIRGIGPKFAERLVNKFQAKTLDIIDKDPERLFEVSGVGPARVTSIIEAWKDQKEISKVMVFLQGRGVSTAFATKIYKTYGNDSIKTIEENPYRLVEEIWGVGFKTADELALKMGFEKDSLFRVKSGVLHSISEVVSKGSLYIELEHLKGETSKLLELEQESVGKLISRALRELYNSEKILLLDHEEKHFITLPKYYFSEKGIATKLLRLKNGATAFPHLDYDQIYKALRKPDAGGVQLNEEQQRGVITCLQHRVTVITGGPGTGKTTLLKKLLEVIEPYKIKFRLAAPTGRAAKRVFESTGRSAETLHRLLEFCPMFMGFSRNEDNALDLELLVIDESSMIDVFLMHSILKALPQKAHLVFLGDIDQLPSVGAGNILHDLIKSDQVEVILLTEIFRQAQDSMIIVNAHKVNNGEFPVSSLPGSKRDFRFIKQNEPEEVFPLLREIYQKSLPAAGIASKDSIVLTPMNRGVAGTQRLNQELQAILNPNDDKKKQVSRLGYVYKVSDRVMQIRNNYDKFVFNGDIGTISDIRLQDKKLMVLFGERNLEYDFAELDELTLSYAVSIHKSQGSEFKAVIIPIFMQHFILLQRNLIYTAITRAKKLCILMGQSRAIAVGIKKAKGSERLTFLKEFLTTDLEAR